MPTIPFKIGKLEEPKGIKVTIPDQIAENFVWGNPTEHWNAESAIKKLVAEKLAEMRANRSPFPKPDMDNVPSRG